MLFEERAPTRLNATKSVHDCFVCIERQNGFDLSRNSSYQHHRHTSPNQQEYSSTTTIQYSIHIETHMLLLLLYIHNKFERAHIQPERERFNRMLIYTHVDVCTYMVNGMWKSERDAEPIYTTITLSYILKLMHDAHIQRNRV